MNLNVFSLIKTAGKITVETLSALVDILGSPWTAYHFCDAVGLPPIGGSGDWAPAIQELRAKADAATKPEHWAEVTTLALAILGGIKGKFLDELPPGSVQPGTAEALTVKIVMPVLLFVLPRFDIAPSIPKTPRMIVFGVVAGLFFIDQRLQDDHAQGLILDRWGAILGDLARSAGWGRTVDDGDGASHTEPDWAPIVVDALAALTGLAALVVQGKKSFGDGNSRFWFGFDHPDIPAFPLARSLSERAFTALFDNRSDTISETTFDQAIGPQDADQPLSAFGLTFVPVPLDLSPDRKSKLFVQAHGQYEIDHDFGGGFGLKFSNNASFGLLAARDGIEDTTGDVAFQVELVGESSTAPASGPPSALSLHVARFGLGARASVDDLSAWLRIEQGTLSISGQGWLGDFIPPMKLTFDLAVEASVLDGVRLKGGVGGELLIAINQRIPILIGSLRIESLRIRTMLDDADDGSGIHFRVEGTAALSLDLTILKLHVSGLGAAYQVGHSAAGDGNVAGVAKMGWDAVLPQGAGLEVNCWKIHGGGAFFYDAAHDRLSGAVQLMFGDSFSLTGLGLYQRAGDGVPRSWLVVVSMIATQTQPGFSLQGAGMLYGSNRTTNPQAFLDGVSSGSLDAVLFPQDPIGKAPQYLAALEQLFPTEQDAWVLGVMARFTALGGALTLDLGVLFDSPASGSPRIYLIAQLVALLKAPMAGEKVDPLKLPFRILADGVALWDSRTDELDVRIALRNSRVWAGELTGGASLFHGSPQTDGQNRGTYISVGGFHPDYVPPGTRIFVPPRLKLSLGKGDHLKFEATAYVAYTPSSIQFGLAGQLQAQLYGFGIRGRAIFDCLFGFDGTFSIHVEFSVELLVGSQSIAAVMFSGTVSGCVPSVLSGKVEVKFLFWTLSKSGSLTLIDGSTPHEAVDPAATLAAAIADVANWHGGGAAGLALTDATRAGLWLSPNAPMRLMQPVAPLNVALERFGAARLDAPLTLSIDAALAGGSTLATTALPGDFSLGMFLDLSAEEMLASRGFETRDAGIELTRPLDSGAAVTTSADFEEIVLDPLIRPAPGERVPVSVLVSGLLQALVASAGTAPPRPLALRRERFAVVDDVLAAQSNERSFFEARAAQRGSNGALRIVPQSEVTT